MPRYKTFADLANAYAAEKQAKKKAKYLRRTSRKSK